jgi:hypothetical protein
MENSLNKQTCHATACHVTFLNWKIILQTIENVFLQISSSAREINMYFMLIYILSLIIFVNFSHSNRICRYVILASPLSFYIEILQHFYIYK